MASTLYIFLYIAMFYWTSICCSAESSSCDHTYLGRVGTGVITSENFPFHYPSSVTCRHVIYIPRDLYTHPHVCFTFRRFDLENRFDYLEINGTHKYTGRGEESGNTKVTVWDPDFCWAVDQNKQLLTLVFDTDYSVNHAGFYAEFEVINGSFANQSIEEGSATDNATYAPCSVVEFTCFSDRRCIPRTQVCDNRADCADSSDETYAHARCLTGLDACDMDRSGTCGFIEMDGDAWPRYRSSADFLFGPDRDHTRQTLFYTRTQFGTSQNRWLFLHSDSLLEPVPMATSYCLSFWYHMKGVDSGRLYVFWGLPFFPTQNYGYPIWSRNGNFGDRWLHGQMQLNLKDVEDYETVYFVVERGGSLRSQVALDDVSVSPGQCIGLDDMSCNFELDICQWKQLTNTDMEHNTMWMRIKGQDHSSWGKNGYFLHLENLNDWPALGGVISRPVSGPPTGNCFMFYYRVAGDRGMTTTELKVYLHGPNPDDGPSLVWREKVYYPRDWTLAKAEIPNMQPYQIVVEAELTYFNTSVGLDEFSLVEGPCELSDVGTCGLYEFRCNDGRCISQTRVCDIIVDCPEAEDEDPEGRSMCDLGEVTCSADEWRCVSGECVPKEHHCDGVPHCSDHSDEWQCPGSGGWSIPAITGLCLAVLVVVALVLARCSVWAYSRRGRPQGRSRTSSSSSTDDNNDVFLVMPPPSYAECAVNRAFVMNEVEDPVSPPTYNTVMAEKFPQITDPVRIALYYKMDPDRRIQEDRETTPPDTPELGAEATPESRNSASGQSSPDAGQTSQAESTQDRDHNSMMTENTEADPGPEQQCVNTSQEEVETSGSAPNPDTAQDQPYSNNPQTSIINEGPMPSIRLRFSVSTDTDVEV